jgi:hypothetical protein
MTKDNPLAGFTMCDMNPNKRVAKLQERIEHLRVEIQVREDQIAIMEHEIQISGVMNGMQRKTSE